MLATSDYKIFKAGAEDMSGMLYQAVYMFLVATVVLDFIIARAMRFLNVGSSAILSPVIGTALGWLVFLAAPTSIAGIIVGAIATVVCNLILTNVVYPKFNDKMDTVVGNKIEASRGNDFDKALHSPTPDERVKYLCRNMQNNYFYRFQYSADSALVFQQVKEEIDKSSLLAEYPGVKKISDDKNSDLLFHIKTTSQAVGIVFTPATRNSKDAYMLGIYAYADEGKLKERIAFENMIGHLLDRIYTLSSDAIKNLDSTCTVDIVPFKAPY